MKKVVKVVTSGILGTGILFGGLVGDSVMASSDIESSIKGSSYEVPYFDKGEKIVDWRQLKKRQISDSLGILFADYESLEAYKEERDLQYTEEIKTAEYKKDMYAAKLHFGHIAEKDGFGMRYARFNDFNSYREFRELCLEDDMEMAKEIMELKGINITPSLKKVFERDLNEAKEYFEVKALEIL